MSDSVVGQLRAASPEMVSMLADLVTVESPSADTDATAACARLLTQQVQNLLGVAPEVIRRDGRVHLRWQFGGPTKVLLLGHLDTVWPLGTLARWPFEVSGATATGPGCFDMKAGLVQGLWALTQLSDLGGITLLVTSDEEIGSPSSRALIEDSARGARSTLVLEPSADGALKTARKGISSYQLSVVGRAAHAGLEPEKGANAALELARQLLAVEGLGRAELGTTVTPTMLSAGTAMNTVPAAAEGYLDVRVLQVAEQERVDAAMRALTPQLEGTTLVVGGGPNRPPMEETASSGLFGRAQAVAHAAGLSPLRGVAVGGASDGNFTAALGIPTLDGLGAVGAGAHAEGEYVEVAAMAERAALVALLLADLRETDVD